MEKLFTTLVVLNRAEGGYFVKVTFPFDETGLSDDEVIEKVISLMPGVHVILIPDVGLYDVGTGKFRKMWVNEQVLEMNWHKIIDMYSDVQFHASCDLKKPS